MANIITGATDDEYPKAIPYIILVAAPVVQLLATS